ncbi:MAG TPA: glucose 1-dehydrogenase [Kofleriaceae bacterium]|jgi:NAD(P)-dependent dehydrogenase (short-subunit alcohol dehydrogenase family)|nr:glucose 1-dehydrogenase [Kofleriaceae bacterium]
MQGIKDRIALVTGGASGIGRATALAFAREGAQVIVVDRDAAGGEHTIAEIRNSGGRGQFIRADVSVAADVERALGNATKAFGHIDFAVNDAGVEGANNTVREYDEAEFDRVIATNLKSVWLCMKYEIPAMPDRGGAIINVASVAGLVGFTEEPAYVASKHGVIGLTKVAALELGARKIRVNAVCPGAIDTPMLHRSTSGDELAEYVEGTPQRRVGKPEEIASAILWLCSDASAFITGVALPIDGGWTVQ